MCSNSCEHGSISSTLGKGPANRHKWLGGGGVLYRTGNADQSCTCLSRLEPLVLLGIVHNQS